MHVRRGLNLKGHGYKANHKHVQTHGHIHSHYTLTPHDTSHICTHTPYTYKINIHECYIIIYPLSRTSYSQKCYSQTHYLLDKTTFHASSCIVIGPMPIVAGVVTFSHWHTTIWLQKSKTPTFVQSPHCMYGQHSAASAKQILVQLTVQIAIILVSSSWKFGAVLPYVERCGDTS